MVKKGATDEKAAKASIKGVVPAYSRVIWGSNLSLFNNSNSVRLNDRNGTDFSVLT